jgi:hypothetical protein
MVRVALFCLAVLFVLDCKSMKGRVIEKTDTTAVVEGRAATPYEAKKNALEKAADELEGEVVETKEAECNQGFSGRGSTSGTGAHKQYSHKSSTYEICVVFVKKK